MWSKFFTMLGTTEVLIDKMINEQQPRVVYFAQNILLTGVSNC